MTNDLPSRPIYLTVQNDWAAHAGAGGTRAVFLCLAAVEAAVRAETAPVAAYVAAVLEWDLLAACDDVPTIDEVAGFLGRLGPDMLSLPEVERIDLPAGPGVRVHALRAASEPADQRIGERGGTSLVEESLTVGVVCPGAGAATVTGTWPALHAGAGMIEVVMAAAAAMRVEVEEDG